MKARSWTHFLNNSETENSFVRFPIRRLQTFSRLEFIFITTIHYRNEMKLIIYLLTKN